LRSHFYLGTGREGCFSAKSRITAENAEKKRRVSQRKTIKHYILFSPEKGRKVLRRRTKRGYEAHAEQDHFF